MTPVMAIVANPRRSGGGQRRLESIVALGKRQGCRVEVLQPTVSIAPGATTAVGAVTAAGAIAAVTVGGAVPEVLAWDPAPVVRDLAALAPDIVVYQTARALHPAVVGAVRAAPTSGQAPVVEVLDLVDRLSVSYRQRAGTGTGLLAPVFRVLASAHHRFERQLSSESSVRAPLRIVTAGYREARQLGVEWIPNIVVGDAAPPGIRRARPAGAGDGVASHRVPDSSPAGGRSGDGGDRRHDAVFFGTLDYQPNVEALRTLHRWIGDAAGHAPTVLVAGRNPTREVRDLCRANSWTLETDFASVSDLADRAAVAIAPLRSTSGIQNKIMEATRAGLPQVVTPAAVAGYHPDIPLPSFETGPSFLAEIRRLAGRPGAARAQVAQVLSHLEATVSVEAVAPRWARLLHDPAAGPPSATSGNQGSPVDGAHGENEGSQ